MDLGPTLLALLAPIVPGEELLPGVRLVSVSGELGLRVTLEAAGRRVHIELSPHEDNEPHAAATPRLTLAYRTAPRDPDAIAPTEGVRLCSALAARIASNEERVLAELADDVARERETREDDARVREVRGGTLLVHAGTDAEPFLGLSPYVGCTIGCTFCYAQTRLATVRRFVGLPAVRWGSWVDARVDAPELLARELADAPALPIKFSPVVSDPYQPLEARLSITARCLAVLRDEAGARPVLVLTRSSLVRRDAPLLATLPRAFVGVTLPTVDDAIRAHFEPRAAAVSERLATLRLLRAAGVRTFAVVQPMLPGDLDALADALAATCDSVSLDVLRGVYGARREFADPLSAGAGDDAWQATRLTMMRDALAARGVRVWEGELPPDCA